MDKKKVLTVLKCGLLFRKNKLQIVGFAAFFISLL